MNALETDDLSIDDFFNRIVFEDDTIYKSLEERDSVEVSPLEDEIAEISIDASSLSTSSQNSVSFSSNVSTFTAIVSCSQVPASERMCCKCNIEKNVVILFPCGHYTYCAKCWVALPSQIVLCFYCQTQNQSHLIPS